MKNLVNIKSSLSLLLVGLIGFMGLFSFTQPLGAFNWSFWYNYRKECIIG